MVDSRNADDIGGNKDELLQFNDHHNFLEFTHKDEELGSHDSLTNLIKHSLLLGSEKLLMARKSGPLASSGFDHPNGDQEANHTLIKNSKTRGEYASNQNKNVPGLVYNASEFPLNLIAFITVLVLKLTGIQIRLILRFFAFPIWFLNFSLMFVMFPFRTLTHVRDHIKKKLFNEFSSSYLRLISFIKNRLKSQKSLLRFGKAFLCSVYVFFVLVSLLISGFAIGGIITRNALEESIHKTETLNFDYTKTSPIAILPIASSSSLVNGLPNNHKLKVIVSLALPESEYNRKLGIFQVRVESLSANGKVILGSSHPTMLRFKSRPIRAMETLFNSVHLITGLKSEVQNLKIVMGEYNEGYEPIACFKVILEQRAEFEAGSGAPEIYSASLGITSELPQLKKFLWSWRRTVFVWISFVSFVGEMMVFLLFCRPVILPGRRSKVSGSKKKSWPEKISWEKAI